MEVTQIEEVKIEALEKVITESGLQLTDAEQIKQSYTPFFNQLAAIKSDATKINFETPTEIDETIARELRLRTVKIRTGSNQVKDERKKIHLLRGNLEQSAYNLIKSTCELDEERFMQVEKRRELLEKARKAELKKERTEKLLPYCEVAEQLPLGEMNEQAFTDMFNGYKAVHDAKIEAEAKLERERIANEAKQKVFNERKIAVAPFQQFYSVEIHEPLTIETTDAEFEVLVKSLTKLKFDYDLKQEQIRIENEKLKKDAEAKEKLRIAESEKQQAIMKAEREKADALLESQRKQAAKDKELADKKLAEEKAKTEKLMQEAKEKKDADDKAERERIAAEKKAAKAPDKVRLTKAIEEIPLVIIYGDLKSDESKKVASDISEKFKSFKVWALSQIETL